MNRVEHTQHAIAELQNAMQEAVAGAAATTNIAVAGITTADSIGSVVQFSSGVPDVVTAEASITSDGNIQLSTTNTTGDTLLVTWYKKASL